MKREDAVRIYIELSAVAAVLVVVLIFFFGRDNTILPSVDRFTFGIMFILACVFGLSLAIRPGWLRLPENHAKMTSFPPTHSKPELGHEKKNIFPPTMRLMGHHPVCEPFRTHTVKISNETICSGCLGFAIGSIIAAVIAIATILWVWVFPHFLLYLSIAIGFALVALSFLEVGKKRMGTAYHIALSTLIPPGFFLISYSMFTITGNLIIGTLGIIISALWMSARVQISAFRHNRICEKCGQGCIRGTDRG